MTGRRVGACERASLLFARRAGRAGVRPFNFTVSLDGKSAMRTRRQQANLAKEVANVRLQ